MPFSRATPLLIVGPDLDSAMRSIGLRIGAAKAAREPADIEVTLASIVVSAMPHDLRLLGVLIAWLEMHHAHVNVPRLARLIAASDGTDRVRAFWSAVGTWLSRSDVRFRALARLYEGEPLDLDDPEVTRLQLARVGADARFEHSALCVHAKLLRSRAADVDDPVQLAARHPLYLLRVMLGANYRADVWAALDREPEASAAEIARAVGCAYETARSVREDWNTARAALTAA